MKRTVEVPAHIREAFQTKLAECVNIARQRTGKDIPMFPLVFRQMGQLAGGCLTNIVWGDSTILINSDHLKKNYDFQLSTTLPHEVAHAVIDFLYPLIKPTDGLSQLVAVIHKRRFKRQVPAHGQEWVDVMNWFGIQNPIKSHTLDMTDVATRPKVARPFKYLCGCGTPHQLSLRLHEGIQRSGKKRMCRNCRKQIVYEKQWGKPVKATVVEQVTHTVAPVKPMTPATHKTVTRFVDGVLQNVRCPL